MTPPRKAMSLPARIGHERVGERAGAGEVRVDVDHLGAARLRLHHPLEPDGMGLGHVRAHDHDAVGVDEPAVRRWRRHARARFPDRERWRSVRYGPGSRSGWPERGEQLLDQVVLFVVQRGPAQAREPGGAPQDPALGVGLLPAAAAGVEHPVGHHLHGGVQVEVGPLGGARRPVAHLLFALRARHELGGGRALRAEPPPGDRRGGVALDLDDLLVLHEHLLGAAHGAVRAHGLGHPIGRRRARGCGFRARRLGRGPPAQPVGPDELPVDGPRPHERPHPFTHAHARSLRLARDRAVSVCAAQVPPARRKSPPLSLIAAKGT